MSAFALFMFCFHCLLESTVWLWLTNNWFLLVWVSLKPAVIFIHCTLFSCIINSTVNNCLKYHVVVNNGWLALPFDAGHRRARLCRCHIVVRSKRQCSTSWVVCVQLAPTQGLAGSRSLLVAQPLFELHSSWIKSSAKKPEHVLVISSGLDRCHVWHRPCPAWCFRVTKSGRMSKNEKAKILFDILCCQQITYSAFENDWLASGIQWPLKNCCEQKTHLKPCKSEAQAISCKHFTAFFSLIVQ